MKQGILITAVLFLSAIVFAGGFQLSVESGSNRNEALIVKTFGCHTPSDAKLTGIAEGIVNGERKSISLKFKHNQKGVFTIAKQWEDDGVWVIVIKENYNGMNSNAIVKVDSKSNKMIAAGKPVNNLKVKITHKNISSGEITKLLNDLNKEYAGV